MRPDYEMILDKNYRSILLPWGFLFFVNLIILILILFFVPYQTPRDIQTVRIINNFYFLIFILAILTMYFIKKNRLRSDLLNQWMNKTTQPVTLPEKWIRPEPGEKDILNGIPFYLRFHFLVFYLVLLMLSVLNIFYFYLTMDRRGFYMFFIVTLFSLFLHYPRKHIWNQMKITMEEMEEDHDPF
jgi:hypothetical protein